jgi:hypothetical protein
MGNDGFGKAKPELSSVKFAIQGPAKSGKTATTLLCAEGLGKLEKKRIAYVDTEHGTDWYAIPVASRAWHPEAFDFDALYTKSLAVMREKVMGLDLKTYGVVVIDSLTHFWEAAKEAYTGPKEEGRIPVWAWSEIKKPYREVIDFLIKKRIHVFVCGREGDAYEETDIGKVMQVGKKMKADGETPYEFDTLIRIEGVQPMGSGKRQSKKQGGKKTAINKIPTVFVDGDRSGTLPPIIEWPTYAKLIGPIVGLLDRTGTGDRMDSAADANKKDAELFAGEKVDTERVSRDLRISLEGKINASMTLTDLKKATTEITAQKPKLLAADLASLTKTYKDRKAVLDPALNEKRTKDALIAYIAKAVELWDVGSVKRFKEDHLMGNAPDAWAECSITELNILKRALEEKAAKDGPPDDVAGDGGDQ